ncbi:glycosyl transferase [Azospirillum picis]|nr:glycosyl transferase [Azospirillum picis]
MQNQTLLPPAIHVVMPASLPPSSYSRRMMEAVRAAGVEMTAHALPGQHPQIDPSAILAADVTLSRLPDGATVLLDGDALANLAASLPADDRRLRFVALVAHLHWNDPALGTEEAAVRRNLEQGVLALMRRIVVPDEVTAAAVQELGVPDHRLVRASAGPAGAATMIDALQGNL